MFVGNNLTEIYMNLYLIIFTSDSEQFDQDRTYRIHQELFQALEKHFTLHLIPYTEVEDIPGSAYKMAFICSGGVEAKVIRNFSLLPYPITLLTDGLNNSLAAALEIAAWIQTKDMRVHIIHGEIGDMVKSVLSHHQAFAAKRAMKHNRIGVVGTPAPWLVASHVDYLLASQRWGVSYIDIPTEDVYKYFNKITDDEIGMDASIFANRASSCQDATPDDLLKAMRFYKALKMVYQEEQLDAITLSCFSIFNEIKTTGCLSLSLLNDEGIPAGCEGDLQSIMSMLMVKKLTGECCFMGNPTFIDSRQNEILLSHCTIATRMTKEFIIRNHYESGASIGLQGIMEKGPITLFKCGGECLDEYYISGGVLIDNSSLENACRTQFRLKLDKPVSYFLQNPIGNHHILIPGNYVATIQEFMQQNRCKLKE